MKLKQLMSTIDMYTFIAEAGIKEDMAKRIMYSILPAVADKTQIAETGGVVDYKALFSAVHGAKDILKYGIRAVVHELKHYGDLDFKKQFSEDDEKIEYNDAKKAYHADDYAQALEIAISCFRDTDNWHRMYGGYAWEKIAESLLRINNYYEGFLNQQPYSKEAVELAKTVVQELNVFDGLAHNTDSIMQKINAEEKAQKVFDAKNHKMNFPEDGIKETGEEYDYQELLKLMDAKELHNAVDAYKQIEKVLKDSGDINQYKDWVTKIRNTPEYNVTDLDSKTKELFTIRVRKMLKNHLLRLESMITAFSEYPSMTIKGLQDLLNKSQNSLAMILDDVQDSVVASGGDINQLNSQYYQSIVKAIKTYREQMFHGSEILKVENALYDDETVVPSFVFDFFAKRLQLIKSFFMFVSSI